MSSGRLLSYPGAITRFILIDHAAGRSKWLCSRHSDIGPAGGPELSVLSNRTILVGERLGSRPENSVTAKCAGRQRTFPSPNPPARARPPHDATENPRGAATRALPLPAGPQRLKVGARKEAALGEAMRGGRGASEGTDDW